MSVDNSLHHPMTSFTTNLSTAKEDHSHAINATKHFDQSLILKLTKSVTQQRKCIVVTTVQKILIRPSKEGITLSVNTWNSTHVANVMNHLSINTIWLTTKSIPHVLRKKHHILAMIVIPHSPPNRIWQFILRWFMATGLTVAGSVINPIPLKDYWSSMKNFHVEYLIPV